MSQITHVKYPFGKAERQNLASGAAINATVNNSEAILTIAQMTMAGTLNLSINSEMEAGSNLMVKVSADGTNRTLTLGTGLTGLAQTINAGKSYAIAFKYDGSTYIHTSTQILN